MAGFLLIFVRNADIKGFNEQLGCTNIIMDEKKEPGAKAPGSFFL